MLFTIFFYRILFPISVFIFFLVFIFFKKISIYFFEFPPFQWKCWWPTHIGRCVFGHCPGFGCPCRNKSRVGNYRNRSRLNFVENTEIFKKNYYPSHRWGPEAHRNRSIDNCWSGGTSSSETSGNYWNKLVVYKNKIIKTQLGLLYMMNTKKELGISLKSIKIKFNLFLGQILDETMDESKMFSNL